MALIILFSQYLSNISIPLPRSDQKLPLFKLFPVSYLLLLLFVCSPMHDNVDRVLFVYGVTPCCTLLSSLLKVFL